MSIEVHNPLVSTKQTKDAPHRFCVYFDDFTEEVITVTNRPREEIKYPYVLTTSDDARKLLIGDLNPQKYSVIEIANGYKLVEKTESIRIKSAENFLSKLPIVKNNQDVNVIFYINSWKMEVNFNQDTLYRMTGKRYHKHISVNQEKEGKYDNIQLFLIKQNDPNYLIGTIEIDTKKLVSTGYILYDLHKLRPVCGLGEITVLTKKIFKTYGVKRKQNFVRAEFSKRRDKRRLIHDITEQDQKVTNTFTISIKEDKFYLRSNFVQPAEQKIYGDIFLYVLNENNVNILNGMLHIPFNDVGYNQTVLLNTDIDLTTCKIMTREEHKNITFDMNLGEN